MKITRLAIILHDRFPCSHIATLAVFLQLLVCFSRHGVHGLLSVALPAKLRVKAFIACWLLYHSDPPVFCFVSVFIIAPCFGLLSLLLYEGVSFTTNRQRMVSGYTALHWLMVFLYFGWKVGVVFSIRRPGPPFPRSRFFPIALKELGLGIYGPILRFSLMTKLFACGRLLPYTVAGL
ncbi:hypothetical protein P154DRAFT_216167 [Amniculicola lignicola CBS 123094]|uniref:Uncharacterized protein n=1 Tax=Amniculicola lignicola CBS 123094 TaxID=1392246 RepID=A0A6A5WCM3_9PLEO|nr:hypothetical protein P154DRAFT_216167 [Amniculicola lignicola CBS 123094]